MKNISKESLLGLEIILPSLNEQKAIAAILSTWDEAIEKTERLIDLKEKYYKALFQQLIQKAESCSADKHIFKLEDLVASIRVKWSFKIANAKDVPT